MSQEWRIFAKSYVPSPKCQRPDTVWVRTEARRCRAPPSPEAGGLSVPSLSEGTNDTTIVTLLLIVEVIDQGATLFRSNTSLEF